MESNPAYGYRRVAAALKKNWKKILRIMRNNGLKPCPAAENSVKREMSVCRWPNIATI